MLESTLVYADHAYYGQTAQFFLALYIILIGPVFFFLYKVFRSHWVWALFVAIPAAIAAETAIGYFIFVNRCETEAGINVLNPPPPTRGFIAMPPKDLSMGWRMKCTTMCMQGLRDDEYEFVEQPLFRHDEFVGDPSGRGRVKSKYHILPQVVGFRFERYPPNSNRCYGRRLETPGKRLPGAEYSPLTRTSRFCIASTPITSFSADAEYDENWKSSYTFSVNLTRVTSADDDVVFSERKRITFGSGYLAHWLYRMTDLSGAGQHYITCERHYEDSWLHTMVGVPVAR